MKRVLYIMYTDPAFYPPVINGSQILAEKGCQVEIIGAAVFGAPDLSVKKIEGRIVNKIRWAPSPGLFQKIHYLYYFAAVILKVLIFRPHWIYASDMLSVPIALFCHIFRE